MGFYIEMTRATKAPEYRENFIPFVYFGLLGFSGLALVGMAVAANEVLADLAAVGSSFWDKILVYGPIACVPVIGAMTVKLAAARKYIRFEGDTVEWGTRLAGKPFRLRTLNRPQVVGFELENHRPKSNLAPQHHDNPAYYIRGHWRLMMKTKEGNPLLLDRHTEREALIPLYDDLNAWLHSK